MNGYSRLASLMAYHDELAIVRGYKSAYALDLLYHKVELSHLLQDWVEDVNADQKAEDQARRSYDTYFFNLRFPSDEQGQSSQWDKWLEIRRKLKEYRQAIRDFREVTEEPRPSRANVSTLRWWLKEAGGGNNFLRGSERDLWHERDEHDLISLENMKHHDKALDKLILYMVSLLPSNITARFIKEVELKNSFLAERPIGTPLKEISNESLHRIISVLSTVLASILPAMSIFALIYIQSQALRLGIIVIFSLLFSTVLMLVAKASRIECFAATAALAAVQAVFVGQQNQICSC